MLLLLLAAQTTPPLSADQRMWDNPPIEMIDFLGRGRLCAQLAEPAHRDAGERTAADRWRCAALPGEEQGWRARYADNALVRAWLDLDPIRFRLNDIVVNAWHGPPSAETRRVEQTGVDARTGQGYRLIIDSEADGGRRIRVTASFAGLAPRSFTFDAATVPWLDLQSLQVALGARPARGDMLYVTLRYGELLGYCQLDEDDDRPEVSIVFERERVHGERSERTNCQDSRVDLPDTAAR